MKILYLNKIETNEGWGADYFLRDALEKAGVETESVDYMLHEFGMARAIGGLSADFDAVLVQRGCGYVFPADVLRAVRRPKVLLFTELAARNSAQYSLIGSGCFDYIYVRTPACRDFMVSRGWIADDRCSVFLSACPDSYLDESSAVAEGDKDIDVLWIGTIHPRRRAILDRIRGRVELTEVHQFGEEMAGLVRRAKIVLNIHGEDWLDTETRVYEVLGCGGFLVSERLSQESPFQSGKHLVEAESVDGMIGHIEEYLGKPGERARIAAAGCGEVRLNHTYAARAKEVAAVLSRVAGDSDAAGTPLTDGALVEKAAARERSLERRARARSWLGAAARKIKGLGQ
ncbi:MAG: glycosyltransferase [Verrucomicrobiales bacterium]